MSAAAAWCRSSVVRHPEVRAERVSRSESKDEGQCFSAPSPFEAALRAHLRVTEESHRRPSRRCVRRAGRGDVEIGSQLRHFAHQAHEPVVAAAQRMRLALILDRAAHFVAARQAIDVGALVGQPRQPHGEILELFGNDVDDALFRLHAAGDRHIARAQHHRPHTLEHFRPDDRVGDRALVLDGHEHHALGRARPLPAGDQAGNRHARVVVRAAQRLVTQDAARVEIGAQELRRMRAQRQAQETVVVHDFLAQRHGGQGDFGFLSPHAVRDRESAARAG